MFANLFPKFSIFVFAFFSPVGETYNQHMDTDKKFFVTRDLNGDDIIDFEEVREMVHPDGDKQAKKYISFLFKELDKDKNGMLDLKESLSGRDRFSLFDAAVHQLPALKKDDVAGPPVDPPTRINYTVYKITTRDEL